MYVFDLPNRKATPTFPLKAGAKLLVAWEVENPVSTISTSETDPVLDCAATQAPPVTIVEATGMPFAGVGATGVLTVVHEYQFPAR
jgi:hypothetical protein